MTDLLQSLLEAERAHRRGDPPDVYYGDLVEDARKEIERLNAVRDELFSSRIHLISENERLREAVDGKLREDRDYLLEENERLRTTLRYVWHYGQPKVAALRAEFIALGRITNADPEPSSPRCKHGVWLSDHCYSCAAETVGAPCK